VRDFAEREIAPVVQDHWGRAEFPFEIVPKLAALDIVGLGYGRPDRPAASRLLSSFVSMELARVDASMATFFGVHSGLAMGSIVQCGSEEQQARWLPAMFRSRRSARSR
jgi:glutaryl-CoA dehydrogenase